MSTTLAGNADNLYRELGCAPDVSAAELKQAYHKLAREFHPDLTNNKSDAAQDAAHDRFVKITAAFDVLGDDTKRQEYDRTLVVAAAYGTPAGRTVNGYTYRTTGRGEHSDDQGYGFHKGDFDGDKSPYKIFSNTGIVFLALTWMIGGIVVHIWRFTEAQEEVTAMVEQRSRNAAVSLNQAQSRARENGHMLQLEMLRDRAAGNKVMPPPPPTGSVVS